MTMILSDIPVAYSRAPKQPEKKCLANAKPYLWDSSTYPWPQSFSGTILPFPQICKTLLPTPGHRVLWHYPSLSPKSLLLSPLTYWDPVSQVRVLINRKGAGPMKPHKYHFEINSSSYLNIFRLLYPTILRLPFSKDLTQPEFTETAWDHSCCN